METYEEHIQRVLAAGGAHECASDCPVPPPRRMTEDRVPTICAACGGTDEPVVNVPLHPRCAAQPAPPLDVERLAEWFHNKWESQGIACWHRNQHMTAWDCGRDAMEAAEYARIGSAATQRAPCHAWCWLPKDHPGLCEGDQ